jgi:hypothetical protein
LQLDAIAVRVRQPEAGFDDRRERRERFSGGIVRWR